MTSLTWTSRQARTQRLHWMQASRLTRIAGWLASGAQRVGSREAARARRRRARPSAQNCGGRVVRGRPRRLVGDQELHDHGAGLLGALRVGVHLHAGAPACGCRRRPARARPRSRPCRRGNCRPAGSRAAAEWQRCGMSVPSRCATCQIVSPGRGLDLTAVELEGDGRGGALAGPSRSFGGLQGGKRLRGNSA